jgi:cytochrome c553
MFRGVNWLLAARVAVGLVALQAGGCGGGCGGGGGGGRAPIQSRASSESCVLPTDGRPAAAYQAAITTFLGGSCYASWQHDPSPRLTGAAVDGATYTVHDYIKVFYSPSLVTWIRENRPATGVSPSTVAPMPQDAAIVAEIYPSATATTPSGRLVMTRQTAAPAAARPASGWFFSQIVTDASTWRATSLTTSAGDYSLGACIGCHASAVDNFTSVSTSNLLGQPLQLADWRPSFPSPSTTDLPAPVTPPATRQLRTPLDDAAAQQFIDFYNRAVPEFQANHLPAASQLPMSKVLALPGQATDTYYLRAGQPSFVTSSQCKGCHDASALLSVLSGGQHTWAAPQMSFKHPTGWGDTQPPADKFNLSPYGEWSVSIMALAARDPVFLAQAETERVLHPSVTPTAIDNFCFRCHGPMGQRQFHRDHGGDPTQLPPDQQPAPQGNFSHYMSGFEGSGSDGTSVQSACRVKGSTGILRRYPSVTRACSDSGYRPLSAWYWSMRSRNRYRSSRSTASLAWMIADL